MTTTTVPSACPTIDRAVVSRLVRLFDLAADSTRLTILLTLRKKPRNVKELVLLFGMSQPAVSHHLALLKYGGLVHSSREGKFSVYALTEQGQTLMKGLNELLNFS